MTRFATRALAALTLTAALAAPIGGTAETTEYYTLGQLRERTETRWTQTYETPWRTLNVDANIYMPEADSTPVFKMKYIDVQPALTEEESGWDTVESRPNGLVLSSYDSDVAMIPKSRDGRRIERTSFEVNLYENIRPEDKYIPLCEKTYGEIAQETKDEIARFGFDPDHFDFDLPQKLEVKHRFFVGTEEDAVPGRLFLTINLKFANIPVLAHVLTTMSQPGQNGRVSDEPEVFTQMHAVYSGIQERPVSIFIESMDVLETLADDVPLCGFETVRANIEKEIATGRMCDLFDVKFGYLVYNEPGAVHVRGQYIDFANVPFYLKPAWIVDCRLLVNPTDEPAAGLYGDRFDAERGDKRTACDNFQIAFDAQTGERIAFTEAADRAYFKGFLSWDDVGGRPE